MRRCIGLLGALALAAVVCLPMLAKAAEVPRNSLVINPQPKWADGRTPDALGDIRGGFTDGEGNQFPVPLHLKARGPVGAVKNESGLWCWKTYGAAKRKYVAALTS